ncbi:Fag s 1 pollen allergen [Heracleum sosnowskyi]|uniref:Fag s 1 pollen allergen n=1 Tax=Heracleum sosnowskyi TaxID=360622 RepID=A0AAD8ISU2_9APIA|nr:Fag s 1 pollen allergen [Heracleum sosnowskyi]
MDSLIPQVLRGAIKSSEILQGDGRVGTIKLVQLGDASPFNTMKQRIDAIDNEALTYNYTIIDGDILLGFIESIYSHVAFVPTADGGCNVKNTIIFNTKGDAVVPEDSIKYATETNNAIFKAVEAYLISN